MVLAKKKTAKMPVNSVTADENLGGLAPDWVTALLTKRQRHKHTQDPSKCISVDNMLKSLMSMSYSQGLSWSLNYPSKLLCQDPSRDLSIAGEPSVGML